MPLEPMPRVSIGMPIYNAENFIDDALRSILAQDLTDVEVLIGDNASTDGTLAICERYAATGDTRRAVAEGLSSSARTITSAAAIMAAVFMVFVFTGVPSIRQLGLGNAVAILVDATLVRLVLVPSAMELLGKWNWWLPKPLDRVLPKSSFEEAPTTA